MRHISFLLVLSLATSPIFAQTDESDMPPRPAPPSNEWKSWTFAAIAAATITAGVYILTLDNGHAPNH